MTKYSFHKLLCYLYTDEIPKIATDKCLNLLELANRLCLPRLINLIECRVIEDLTKVSQSDVIETVRNCLQLLEPVKVIIQHRFSFEQIHSTHFPYRFHNKQLHNAHQLAEWCMSYLCVNYNIICKSLPKSLKALHPENQDYLKENRWPPVWYLKDFDYYQRCMNEVNREGKHRGKAYDGDDDGCLCFSGGKCCLTCKYLQIVSCFPINVWFL